jgi:ubiquinone biosynthesis protein
MKSFIRLFRLLHINYVLLKHGLDEIALETSFFRPLHLLIYLSPFRWFNQQQDLRGKRIREALEELGPIFVKFGQVLSTRIDLLPADIIQELVLLQDKVPPFPGSIAREIIENAFQLPISQIFRDFDECPLASASVAQVHTATLLTGESVVVKVLRPNVEKIIRQDLALLTTLANLTNRYWKRARQFKPREIVYEFEKAILGELDLLREAANASQLKRNFLESPLLYIPKIYWQYSKNTLLVMERIRGFSISDKELLKRQGYNLKQLAERAIEILFTQVFRDCFFHADMHPGNLFISFEDRLNPRYIAVDFGIMGALSPADQLYLAENFMAFFKRDYRRVAELHLESGWVPKTTRLDEFETAIRTVCEPILELPLREISFGNLLFRLFQTAKDYEVNIQPQLILLQKTLFNVEGLARQLDPEIDLWGTARPYLENWMKTQVGFPSLYAKIKKYGPYWLARTPDMPNLIYDALQTLATRDQKNSEFLQTKIKVDSKNSNTDLFLGILLGILLTLISFFTWSIFYDGLYFLQDY